MYTICIQVYHLLEINGTIHWKLSFQPLVDQEVNFPASLDAILQADQPHVFSLQTLCMENG